MIRTAILFVQILVLIALSVWLAKEPGSVTVVWRDWQVDTSVGILFMAVGLIAVAITLSFRLWQFLTQTPGRLLTNRRANRERRGYRELADGMLALASGDAARAMKHARKADTFLGRSAAGHLIVAEAAVLQGKSDLAKDCFKSLLEDQHTAVAGARGLLTHAVGTENDSEALMLAEKVRSVDPNAAWVLPKLFGLQVRARNWSAADATMSEAIKRLAVSAEKGRRLRALVLYERGLASSEMSDDEAAVGFFREALDLDASLPRIAIEYSKLLLKSGKKRRSQRVLEQSWMTSKHPDTIEQLIAVTANDEPVDRYRVAKKIISQNLDADTALILARYALEAKLWGEARKHIELTLRERSSVAACEMMAAIEDEEQSVSDAAREWQGKMLTATADKAWVCSNCHANSDSWSPTCQSCGEFDQIDWQFPAALTEAKARVLPMQTVPLLSNS